MRPLEIITPIILAIYVLWPVTGRNRPPAVGILPAFALIILATHTRIEGMRWQMYPLYAFAVLTLLVSLPDFMRARQMEAVTTRPQRVLPSLALLAASTALPMLLPVPSIPRPGGPYQVGTGTFELTDISRQEIYSGKEEARRFKIQVWYPAEASPEDPQASWMEHAEILAPAIATYFDLPPFSLEHLALVKIPAYEGAKAAASSNAYPIILFSHGWNGFSAQNSSQALQLASHGCIVIAVQHTYGAIVTVFSDGTIANNNPMALPAGSPMEEYEAVARTLADQWAGDLSFTLDFLEGQNADPESQFFGLLDLSRVGAYGHSTGGGAAIQFCGTDPRCKAVLGMDPFMRPVSTEVLETGISQPAFFMFSQSWAGDPASRSNKLFEQFIPRVDRSLGVVFIDGTNHTDFTDITLLSPLAPLVGLKGPISGRRMVTIVNDYLLSFFDMTLKGETMPLFEKQNMKYQEVQFIR
jgi:predicted dienelactone hydrolase